MMDRFILTDDKITDNLIGEEYPIEDLQFFINALNSDEYIHTINQLNQIVSNIVSLIDERLEDNQKLVDLSYDKPSETLHGLIAELLIIQEKVNKIINEEVSE